MTQARVNLEEHATKMLSELHRMQQEKDHCDFVIKVQNEVCHTHKNVLSAGSEYFRAMLAHDTKESLCGEITFKDADSECMKSCIDFIYSGEFQVPTGKIKELLHIGIMLRLDGICSCSTLAEILIESINVENYYFTTKIADIYELTGVQSKCQQYFAENLMEIANQPEFGNMPISKLNNFLYGDKLNYTDQEKLIIFLKWADKIPKDSAVLIESIKRFRLEKMSSTFLRNLLKTDPVVSNDLMIYKLISDHLIDTLEKIKNTGDQIVDQKLEKPVEVTFHDAVTTELKPHSNTLTARHIRYLYIYPGNQPDQRRLDVGPNLDEDARKQLRGNGLRYPWPCE